MLLNNECINNEIKEEIKQYLGTNENKTHNSPKPMGHSESSPERKVYSNTCLPKKDRNISNKEPNPTSTRILGTTKNKGWSK